MSKTITGRRPNYYQLVSSQINQPEERNSRWGLKDNWVTVSTPQVNRMKLSCLSCLMCMLRCIFQIKLTFVTKMKEEISKDLLVQVFSLPHTLSHEMEVKLRTMMVCQKSHHPSIRLSSSTIARDWSLCRRWDPSSCSTTKCEMEEETQLHLLDCQALNDDSLIVAAPTYQDLPAAMGNILQHKFKLLLTPCAPKTAATELDNK